MVWTCSVCGIKGEYKSTDPSMCGGGAYLGANGWTSCCNCWLKIDPKSHGEWYKRNGCEQCKQRQPSATAKGEAAPANATQAKVTKAKASAKEESESSEEDSADEDETDVAAAAKKPAGGSSQLSKRRRPAKAAILKHSSANIAGALTKQDSSESDSDSKPIKAATFKRLKPAGGSESEEEGSDNDKPLKKVQGGSDLDSDSPSQVPMIDAATVGGKVKKKQSPFRWGGSDDYRSKLDRLDRFQTVVKSKALLSEDISALHSTLLSAASDSSKQVKDKGRQLCEELWSNLAAHNLASQNQLKAELKQSFQKSSALLAGLCQPLSCANSVVKLCYSESLHDQILDRARVQQILYAFVNLRDEWKDNLSSQQIQLELGSKIKICSTLACSCGPFRVSSDENWLVCEIIMQCPGACTVHLQLGENFKNVLGAKINLEVEVEKPAYLRFIEALELEQKVYPGDEWSVHFDVMSSLSKPWKCNVRDIEGFVRLTTGDFESMSEYAVEVCPDNHEDEENNRFKMTVRNNNMTIGLYSLFVRVQCAGEAVMVDTSQARFSAQCNRDPRKWSAQDVVTFVRQHIDISQSVLRSSDGKEVNGQELVKSGRALSYWLELAPSQSDFEEKMQKIDALLSEIKSLDEEARFTEGPHKFLLEDCIMKRDLEIDTERIGAGGSSEVFRAVWKDRIVAVKMPPKGLKIVLALIKDLQLEMRRMQRCSHKNVVVCHGLMVEPCSPTSAGIVMELCSGTLLDLFVESKEPPWKKRLSAALDAARGLEYLHSRSIIHRDVKPQNLLIAAGGVIKVADFGLARRAELTATRLTSIVGTEGWMSPEQLEGREGPPSDVWGFGCIIYFLITGQPPWPDSYTPAAIRTAIYKDRVCPSAPKPLPNGCPAGFAQLCNTCCQFESAPRPEFNSIVQSIEKLVAGFPEDEGFRLPSYWSADGAGAAGTERGDALVEVMPTEKEYEKVVAYLQLFMPAATVSRVEMHCNSALYRMYYWSRDKVARQSGEDGVGSSTEDQSNERWLWHGIRDTRAISEVLKSGYQVQHASLDFNFYGAGNYFASDARLANWFAQGLRARAQPPPLHGAGLQKRRLLLNRVACGRMYPKVSVLDSSFNKLGRRLNPSASQADASLVRSLLRGTEHRTAPSGFDSVVGNDPRREPGTEVIVFDNYLAYPAYVVTYTLPDDLPDPYTQPRPYLKTLDQVPRDPFA